jgi:hypothetical protein
MEKLSDSASIIIDVGKSCQAQHGLSKKAAVTQMVYPKY